MGFRWSHPPDGTFPLRFDIIAFSNNLSYRGEIKPLREDNAVKLRPHVIPYRVEPIPSEKNDVNMAEAEAIASLIWRLSSSRNTP